MVSAFTIEGFRNCDYHCAALESLRGLWFSLWLMSLPRKILVEGIDRLGKDMLLQGIQHRNGFHLVLRYEKPLVLDCYSADTVRSPQRLYQEASFRTLLNILSIDRDIKILCNRSHLGEFVYAPLYRQYSGEYIFELERESRLNEKTDVRLVLLTEDFKYSRHFIDDGKSLGETEKRQTEQTIFIEAFQRSLISDKRIICVTDPSSGAFRAATEILDEALR
jgi:hypothetical protein